MRRWIVLPLLLSLSACWISKGMLYEPDPSLPAPFASGLYSSPATPGDESRVTRLADGRFRMGPVKEAAAADIGAFTFQPLAIQGRKLWIAQVPVGTPVEFSLYELTEVRPNGDILMSKLDCVGTEAIVRAAGGTVEADAGGDRAGSGCLFPNRASLETAAIAYAKAHDPLPSDGPVRRLGD